MLSLFHYGNYTFKIWFLITFESLELKQSCVPHLKVLMCGINTSSYQWCGFTFILYYSHLNLALLLHKTALVNFPIGTTVAFNIPSSEIKCIFTGLSSKKINCSKMNFLSCLILNWMNTSNFLSHKIRIPNHIILNMDGKYISKKFI